MAKKALELSKDEIVQLLAMCFIVEEADYGNAEGHTVSIKKRVVDKLQKKLALAAAGK